MFKYSVLTLSLLLSSVQGHASDDHKSVSLWSVISKFFGSMSQFPCFEEEEPVGEYKGSRHSDGKYMFYQNGRKTTICSSTGKTFDLTAPIVPQKLLVSSDGAYLFMFNAEKFFMIDLLTLEEFEIKTGKFDVSILDIYEANSKLHILYKSGELVFLKVFDIKKDLKNPELKIHSSFSNTGNPSKLLGVSFNSCNYCILLKDSDKFEIAKYAIYSTGYGDSLRRESRFFNGIDQKESREIETAKVCGNYLFILDEHTCTKTHTLCKIGVRTTKPFESLTVVSMNNGAFVKSIPLSSGGCNNMHCKIIDSRKGASEEQDFFEIYSFDTASENKLIVVNKVENKFLIIDAETLDIQRISVGGNLLSLKNPLLLGTCMHLEDEEGKDYTFNLGNWRKDLPANDPDCFTLNHLSLMSKKCKILSCNSSCNFITGSFLTWVVLSQSPFSVLPTDIRFYLMGTFLAQFDLANLCLARTKTLDWSK